MLTTHQMQSLPVFFAEIPDPRRAQGRRHRLATVLAISGGACLCGMRGYRAIADWAKSLGKNARRRFGCRYYNGQHLVPSEYIIRIERHFIEKKSGKSSCEVAYGITSRTVAEAKPERLLAINRGHWAIENSCHYILDWNYDGDRSRIRIGYGPEKITRLKSIRYWCH